MRPNIRYSKFQLPSRGKCANGVLEDGTVEIRKLTVGEEIIIQSSATDVMGKVIDACVKMPNGVTADQLLLGDRLALFLALRVQTFGPKYGYTYDCPHCGTRNKAAVDLSKDIKPQYAADGLEEPIKVTLPDAGSTVILRFLRGRDEAEIAKVARATTLKSNDASDPSSLMRMALQLIAVDDTPVEDQKEREEYVRFLTMTDAQVWRDAMDAVEPGVDLGVSHVCVSCGATNKSVLPFTSEFFRPA